MMEFGQFVVLGFDLRVCGLVADSENIIVVHWAREVVSDLGEVKFEA